MLTGNKKFSIPVLIFVAFFQNNANAISRNTEHYFGTRPGSSSPCAPQLDNAPLRLTITRATEEEHSYLVSWQLDEEFITDSERIPQLGDEVTVARCLPPGLYQSIAKGHVDQVNGKMVTAKVTIPKNGEINLGKWSLEQAKQGNLFARPMAGDEVIPYQHKVVNHKLFISPIVVIAHEDLFEKTNSETYSFSLSEFGRSQLKEKFKVFAKTSGNLQIQGFVLKPGDPNKLREESLLRAQAVANYLVREFNLDQRKIIPIGYSNDWFNQETNTMNNLPSEGVIIKSLPSQFSHVAFR